MIGGSVLYFILLVVLVIYLTKLLTLKKLKEMQSPNIVYFLKKKIIQYSTVPKDDRDYGNDNYPPPPPLPMNNYDRFQQQQTEMEKLPIHQPSRFQNKDFEGLPPPPQVPPRFENSAFGQTDQVARLDTATGFADTSNQQPVRPTQRPKVDIKPYKFALE